MAKKTTTISVESDFIIAAKKRELNISRICETALKAVLGVDDSISKLRMKKEELTVQLIAVKSELDRQESNSLKAVTDQEIKDAKNARREKIIAQYLEIRARRIREEGSVPPVTNSVWAGKLHISVEEIELLAKAHDEKRKLHRKKGGVGDG